MKEQQKNSVQDWLPFENILDKGIVKLKEPNTYIKIIKIIPINYSLKSELEKEAILNSYKIFLKTCNFDLQILIQSNKEDLSQNISNIKEQMKKEKNQKIISLSQKYINFIQKSNKEIKSSSKNFYILIKKSNEINNQKLDLEERTKQELNENYFKIKECLSRCGNNVIEISSKKELEEVFYSFLNSRMFLNKD